MSRLPCPLLSLKLRFVFPHVLACEFMQVGGSMTQSVMQIDPEIHFQEVAQKISLFIDRLN